MRRWEKLTFEQLRGANYALRLLHTSPRVRGAALGLLKELIEETVADLKERKSAPSPITISREDVERVREALEYTIKHCTRPPLSACEPTATIGTHAEVALAIVVTALEKHPDSDAEQAPDSDS